MSKKTEEMADAIVPTSGAIGTAYGNPKEFGQKTAHKGGPRTAVQDNIGWNQTHSTDEETEGGGPTKVGGHIAKRNG